MNHTPACTATALAPTNPWALLPSLGNLDAYISAANRMPMLTLEEEQEYARKLKDHNDLDAAGRLILSHLRLVISLSRQYLGYGLPQGDLIQEGNVGLMKAVKRFDPDQGVRLVSYAMHWIKAEIHEYIIKNWRMVKVATTKAQRKLFFNLRSMKQGMQTDAAMDSDAALRDTLTPSKSTPWPANWASSRGGDGNGSALWLAAMCCWTLRPAMMARPPSAPSPTWPTAAMNPPPCSNRASAMCWPVMASPTRWTGWMSAAAASLSSAGCRSMTTAAAA